MIKINLQYYKLRYRNISLFNLRGLKLMTSFFKFLIPQLMEYFHNDNEILLEFIPKVIEEKYKNELNNLNLKK